MDEVQPVVGAARSRSTAPSHAPGMRRVRLLCWKLFYGTPMNIPIEEWVERGVARQCKLTWEDYCALKSAHPALWTRWAGKRARIQQTGRWPKQPPQLRRARKVEAPRRALLRKARPRFIEWAEKKLLRLRDYKRQWLRERVLDRLLVRTVVPRAEERRMRQEVMRGWL